ncbi:hypothetical protein [Pareuzebyella sediminis]|uniref:hypothetical protein n=1 Tax=Pareuzebyella sediminis TaxID=2607998 RepID=UPI0011ED0C12|nr:hypothetical protein [Pareuzebyella sediminis]
MKKVIVVLMVMLSATTFAQKGEKYRRGDMRQMTATQMATLKTKKMALALDLTKEQQAKIQALNLENATQLTERIAERKARRNSGEMHKPSADERFERENQHLDRMIAQKGKMKKILSDEQYVRWEKMVRRNATHRKGKRDHRSARR